MQVRRKCSNCGSTKVSEDIIQLIVSHGNAPEVMNMGADKFRHDVRPHLKKKWKQIGKTYFIKYSDLEGWFDNLPSADFPKATVEEIARSAVQGNAFSHASQEFDPSEL